MMRARVERPPGMSNEEFFGVLQRESVASREALEAGVIRELYKVSGQNEVSGILKAETADTIDEAIHALPMWTEGCSTMMKLEWTPLRPYESWGRQLDALVVETTRR